VKENMTLFTVPTVFVQNATKYYTKVNIFDAIGKIMKRKLRNQEKWRKEEK